MAVTIRSSAYSVIFILPSLTIILSYHFKALHIVLCKVYVFVRMSCAYLCVCVYSYSRISYVKHETEHYRLYVVTAKYGHRIKLQLTRKFMSTLDSLQRKNVSSGRTLCARHATNCVVRRKSDHYERNKKQ